MKKTIAQRFLEKRDSKDNGVSLPKEKLYNGTVYILQGEPIKNSVSGVWEGRYKSKFNDKFPMKTIWVNTSGDVEES